MVIVVLERVWKIMGKDYINFMEKRYQSIDHLKMLIEKDPNNELYSGDLENWKYYLKNPEKPVNVPEVQISPEEEQRIKRLMEIREKIELS